MSGAELNGNPYPKSFLLHEDIRKGGRFAFELSDQAVVSSNLEIPSTSIKENGIVSVPYFDVSTNKFNTSASVSIRTIVPGQKIYYSIIPQGASQKVRYTLYQRPFKLTKHATVLAYAVDGAKQSAVVDQYFHKLPSGRTITVTSKVHPMYTAGGPESLVDSLFGTTNWRTGEWQSYFDTDFEAVVDLQNVKPVHYLGVHVLQDVSPWILYPKEVIFYSSEDGKNFTQIGRVSNVVEPKMDGPHIQEMGTSVKASARYIKVKATTGGKLPAWHESAGNPSHLFIDEVIVK